MDTVFYWASKLLWILIAPDHLILILLTVVCGLFWLGYFDYALYSLSVLLVSVWLIALFPVGSWLLYPLEARFPVNPRLPENIDGIIMLGGAEKIDASYAWHQVELKAYSERALAFMQLVRQYPHAKRVFTGGIKSKFDQHFHEADVAKLLFEQQGLDTATVKFERHARNTYENALLTKDLVKPKQGEQWLLITSASHMPRAVGVFCQVDWPVVPYPVDHWTVPGGFMSVNFSFAENLEQLTFAVREWVGLAAYYLTGKTTALIPGDCR
ncbi:MAG: YdcF family protein [Methylomicrobium sp.]